ncbi:hypothetical protein BpHYR1_014468 [Brachionus plicatilis]|uniref:Uncharacterized protein n=1 Tax=Brachionus plicatilis TaxID=10195 RepID=A0A3M7PZB9_BRAPC|nr:hypothetical protein BpHYR1_014468 [Brachionus plicatilis]
MHRNLVTFTKTLVVYFIIINQIQNSIEKDWVKLAKFYGIYNIIAIGVCLGIPKQAFAYLRDNVALQPLELIYLKSSIRSRAGKKVKI